jgi:hypothetical protein
MTIFRFFAYKQSQHALMMCSDLKYFFGTVKLTLPGKCTKHLCSDSCKSAYSLNSTRPVEGFSQWEGINKKTRAVHSKRKFVQSYLEGPNSQRFVRHARHLITMWRIIHITQITLLWVQKFEMTGWSAIEFESSGSPVRTSQPKSISTNSASSSNVEYHKPKSGNALNFQIQDNI